MKISLRTAGRCLTGKTTRLNGKRLLLACLLIATLLFSTIALTGCTERQRKQIKHFKSDLIGLKRRVTLYDCNGHPIKSWEGRFKIEVQGAYLSFIDDDGKDIKISGTIVVEEL